MKVILSSTVTLAILAAATSTDTEGNKLANCFSRCESEWGTGPAANPCRSSCRSDETWSGRDYKNRRNPNKSRRYRNGDDRYRNDDAVSNWDEDPDEAVVDRLNKIMAFSMPDKDDDDDDDDTKTRTIVRPTCVVDGQNYQRCASGSMLAADEKTCKELEDYVCKKPATEADEAYCECIGLGKRSTLLHSVIERSVSNWDEDPDEAVVDRLNEIMAFSMPDKDDDDDDDDTKTRTIVRPTCVVDGQNYQRCASGSMLAADEKTCKELEDYVCKKPATDADEAYCQCIGLGKRSTWLRTSISL